MRARHTDRPIFFIDESKSGKYIMAASAIVDINVATIRKQLESEARRLGRSRLHFVKLDDSDRKQVLSNLEPIGPVVTVYMAESRNHRVGRESCIRSIAADAIAVNAKKVLFEQDASVAANDRRLLREILFSAGNVNTFEYDHSDPTLESCLWLSDAIAWCEQAGGDWKRRSQPLVRARKIAQ